MTSVSTSMYIDKLDEINTTIHIIAQSKWGLLTLKMIRILTLVKKVMLKVLNLKFKIM